MYSSLGLLELLVVFISCLCLTMSKSLILVVKGRNRQKVFLCCGVGVASVRWERKSIENFFVQVPGPVF